MIYRLNSIGVNIVFAGCSNLYYS